MHLKPGAPRFKPEPEPTEPEPKGSGAGLANDCTAPQVWVQVQPKRARTHTELDCRQSSHYCPRCIYQVLVEYPSSSDTPALLPSTFTLFPIYHSIPHVLTCTTDPVY